MSRRSPLRPYRTRLVAALLAVVCGLVLAAIGAPRTSYAQGGALVVVVRVEGPVTPVVASHISRAVEHGEKETADLVLVQLDTPGGSVDITERIVRTIDGATVPVAVWVGPRGSQAASAGTFIVLAGHVAAMAPGTTIGAASPIDASGQDLGDTAEKKAMNMLMAKMRSLARRRGQQAEEWAVSAVRDAAAVTEVEALDMGVVDVVAIDAAELLEKLDGRQVQVDGEWLVLNTAGAEMRDVEMGWSQGVVNQFANPTIAFLLITLGMAGLVYEVVNPGFGFSGVMGGICLLSGLYLTGMMPVNYAGVGLIALAFILFVVDVKAGAGGLLALGGVISMIAGGILLFSDPAYTVSRVAIVTCALSMGLFFTFAAGAAYKIQKRKATTGVEGLVGAVGVVREDLDPDGIVVVQGERWRATSADGPVPVGDRVTVTEVDKLRIRVRRADPSAETGPAQTKEI